AWNSPASRSIGVWSWLGEYSEGTQADRPAAMSALMNKRNMKPPPENLISRSTSVISGPGVGRLSPEYSVFVTKPNRNCLQPVPSRVTRGVSPRNARGPPRWTLWRGSRILGRHDAPPSTSSLRGRPPAWPWRELPLLGAGAEFSDDRHRRGAPLVAHAGGAVLHGPAVG